MSPKSPASPATFSLYEYALTEDGGLVSDVICKFGYWTRFRAADRADADPTDSNQLRYVCRQLYAETTGLGLRFNDVIFQSHPEDSIVSVYDIFHRFIHNCSPEYLAIIRRIELVDNHQDSPQRVFLFVGLQSSDLVRFCQIYDQTTVIVRFDSRSWIGGTQYVRFMVFLHDVLRGVAMFPCNFHRHENYWDLLFSHIPCPPNLRFSLTRDFPESKLVKWELERLVGTKK